MTIIFCDENGNEFEIIKNYLIIPQIGSTIEIDEYGIYKVKKIHYDYLRDQIKISVVRS